MKKKNKFKKQFIVFGSILFLTIALMVSFMVGYGFIISNRLFEASSANIEETYLEVSQVVETITKSRWNYLEQIGVYLETSTETPEKKSERIKSLQSNYKFTEFYLVADNSSCMSLDGEIVHVELGDDLFKLIDDGENILIDSSLPQRDDVFFYAVKTNQLTYDYKINGQDKSFTYNAVAFAYSSSDLSGVLKTNAYDGKSNACLIKKNGRVSLNIGSYETNFPNFISWLKKTNISTTDLDNIIDDLNDGNTKTYLLNYNNVAYYVNYQPLLINDWILVSLTPQSVADSAMTNVRLSSIIMVVIVCVILFLYIFIVMATWLRKSINNSRTLAKERELIFDIMSKHLDKIFILFNSINKHIVYVSPNVDRMLGLTSDEIYESVDRLTSCFGDQSALSWANDGFISEIKPGETKNYEYNLRNDKTKEVHPYSLELYRPDDENRNTFVIVLSDNTKEIAIRNGISDALEEAKRASKTKSTFMSSISHDIRTPMNAIVGFSNLLETNYNNPEKVLDYTKKIKSSSDHLLGLISDVLDMSKIESGSSTLNLESGNIYDISNEIVELLSPLSDAKNQTLKVNIDKLTNINVLVDKVRLKQILQNIISNAIKYTPNKGTIDFTVNNNNNNILDFAKYTFIIQDNGIGMSEEYLSEIFEPFSREKNQATRNIEGTGLGMAITKNLIDMMNGSIKVESKINEGSKFTVELTFKVDDSDKQETETTNQEFDLSGLNILAAEDNELNREILVELLNNEGIKVDVAINGKEVTEKFLASKEGSYDCILMDVQMPIMDGYEATKIIRNSNHKESKTIPIIAMTANTFTDDVQTAIQSGMSAHLAKPLNMKDLKSTLQRMCFKKDK